MSAVKQKKTAAVSDKTTGKTAVKTSRSAKAPRASKTPPIYDLKLYVAGRTAKSVAAIVNLEKFCEKHLHGQYRIQIIDLLVTPQLAVGDQIVAIPTLVRKLPVPIRKIIGDLSNEERVLVGMQMKRSQA